MSLKGFFDTAGDWIGEALETFGEFVANPKYTLARGEAIKVARAYALKPADLEAFEELWALVIGAMLYSHANHDRLVAEVDAQLAILPELARRAPQGTTLGRSPTRAIANDGLELVHAAGTEGRYVIFSDHHILDAGHRQDFFGPSGNRDLYVEALSRYYGPGGYVLVENGDLEELLIYEPQLHEIEDIWRWSLREVIAYRDRKKRPLLRRIVRANRRYYETVVDAFASKGRYVKITGNHDRDMSKAEFAQIVSDELGRPFPVACDALVLRDGGRTAYIICHGHQFDSTCTPRFAARTGECFSQGSGWAMQGPDRVWRRGYDRIGEWLTSKRPFPNVLVTSEISSTWLDKVEYNGTSVQDVIDAAGKLIGNLNTGRGWENLYTKPIAWEYFENAGDPQKCFDREIKTGDRWVKLRHLDELRIVAGLEKAFGRDVPTLVLGHSHEPRLRAMRPGRGPIDFYLNSGAAGRFENLIWGIEVVDGVPSLISWHRGPGANAPAIRTTWEPATTRVAGLSVSGLQPASKATVDELLDALAEADLAEEAPDARGALIAVDQVLA